MIVTIRTDAPEAEVGIYEGSKQLSYYTWLAARQLGKDLLTVISQQLQKNNADWPDVSGVVVYEGPGSFTGLRIGITVANALAYGQDVPVVGVKGEDWLATGLKRLVNNETDKLALPFYGAEANITMPKK